MNGPFGLKVELWCMAMDAGLNLDDLVASRFGKEDPFSKKARFEEMMVDFGVTVEDLKNVDRGVYGNPEDDYYDDAKKKDSIVVPPDVLAALEYVDPCEKAKRFNIKLDWTDLPYVYPDDPWTIYPDPPSPRMIQKKKKDDDVPTPLATTGAAAAADKQMDDDDVPTDEDDDPVITYGRRGCKRTNDGEIKKKDDDVPTLATTGAAAAGGDKQMDDYQER